MTRSESERGGESIRVLIADGQAISRAAVRMALEEQGLEVCAEAADGTSAAKLAATARPDVAMIDTRLPGDWLGAVSAISAKLPATAIVVVADTEDDLLVALRAGASGYLLKDGNTNRLAVVFRGVLEGEAAIPRRLVPRLIEELRAQRVRPWWQPLQDRGIRMTSRELEVLELLREGLTTAEIAERLWIAPVTVRRHISVIVRRLGVPDREAAIRLTRQRSDA
jgi:DNA-binding NarL/FixJ family response regulator